MIDPHELDGKVAIVTGAGQGMGRAVAERLSAAGARLVVNDLDGEAAARTVQLISGRGGEAVVQSGNVTSAEDVHRVVQGALARFGSVQILVNNAGVLRPTPVIDIEEDEWDFVVGVNLKGTYLCSRAVLPAMREAGWGRIVKLLLHCRQEVQHHRRRALLRSKGGEFWASRAIWRKKRRRTASRSTRCAQD